MTGNYEKLIQFLRQTPTPAADQALGLALQVEAPPWIAPLSQALLQRPGEPGVAFLLQTYHKLDPQVRRTLVDRCTDICGILRQISRSTDAQARLNVVSLIAAGANPKTAYILPYLLHDESPAVRSQAATAFRALAADLKDKLSGVPGAEGGLSNDDTAQFYSTLNVVLETFTHHLRTEVVEAAMSLAESLPEGVWKHFTTERSRVGRAAVEILQRDSNVRFAGFAARALTNGEELGKNVARILASSCNDDFLRCWLNCELPRTDANVRKNLARINRMFRWIEGSLTPLLDSTRACQIRFIDILTMTMIPSAEKLEVLAALVTVSDPLVGEHAINAIVSGAIPGTAEVLLRISRLLQMEFFSPRAAEMVRAHFENPNASITLPFPVIESKLPSENPGPQRRDESPFGQFWATFDRLDPSARSVAIERVRHGEPNFQVRLCEKTGSSEPAERVRAVKITRCAGLVPDFADQLFKLCEDADPNVRSAAVAALADLPDPASQQRLLRALNDPDPRVQANAIEALDCLNAPDLDELLESRLDSSNNRICANAIKAILRPQHLFALRVLDKMLEHHDPAFRRSALWVVEQISPVHLAGKINRIAHQDPDPDLQAHARQTLSALVRAWRQGANTHSRPESEVTR